MNIGLSSNLGSSRENVEQAITHISRLGRLICKSSLYFTAPWGLTEQPHFCNAVVQIDTVMSPHDLLRRLKGIEKQMGRKEFVRWGPREIDLDILTFDDLQINSTDLTIPHPQMFSRAFVLVPLTEIDPRYACARARLSSVELGGVTPLN